MNDHDELRLECLKLAQRHAPFSSAVDEVLSVAESFVAWIELPGPRRDEIKGNFEAMRHHQEEKRTRKPKSVLDSIFGKGGVVG